MEAQLLPGRVRSGFGFRVLLNPGASGGVLVLREVDRGKYHGSDASVITRAYVLSFVGISITAKCSRGP